ncbi:MAG: condensation domain-containing protein [Chryseobacterium sp.]|nr:condensation domain-containing protein [Chryseobacterium sp.]MDN5422157.1 condensation domain-containing protein [Chryseobacterium sp.]MDN5475864.1 condensation domain-containing protein [Chryseobacterium sp.]MDN5479955.1 condensation domain-containing protein [Chryseobacterium sp.]
MKRKLLFGERILLGDGTEPFNVVIAFRLRGTFKKEEIQHALSRLQGKHPWLRALIHHDENKVPWFEVLEKNVPIPIRIVSRRGDDDWQEESRREWETLFKYGEQPLLRFIWIRGEEVSDMLFSFHHCLCDGGSALAFLYEFLTILDHPSAEIGVENPILGIHDVVPESILTNRTQKLKAKLIGRVAATAIKCIPVGKKAVERQNDYLIHWKFDKEISKELISYCKSMEVTVNTFLCAVVLQAFKKVKGAAAFNKVSCPVDIRRFANQIKEDHIFAFGLMIVVSANHKISFSENLRLMQESVERKTSKLNPYITMMVMESAHDALKSFTKLLKHGKSSNDCMFSNLGRIQIPHQYKAFTLETIFSPSVIGPLGNTTTMVTSTFNGEMDFSFVGSEGYLPYSEALAIRDEVIQTVKEQLDPISVL